MFLSPKKRFPPLVDPKIRPRGTRGMKIRPQWIRVKVEATRKKTTLGILISPIHQRRRRHRSSPARKCPQATGEWWWANIRSRWQLFFREGGNSEFLRECEFQRRWTNIFWVAAGESSFVRRGRTLRKWNCFDPKLAAIISGSSRRDEYSIGTRALIQFGSKFARVALSVWVFVKRGFFARAIRNGSF